MFGVCFIWFYRLHFLQLLQPFLSRFCRRPVGARSSGVSFCQPASSARLRAWEMTPKSRKTKRQGGWFLEFLEWNRVNVNFRSIDFWLFKQVRSENVTSVHEFRKVDLFCWFGHSYWESFLCQNIQIKIFGWSKSKRTTSRDMSLRPKFQKWHCDGQQIDGPSETQRNLSYIVLAKNALQTNERTKLFIERQGYI